MRNFSILDTDLYKFTVSYAYMKMFPDAECTFTYTDRNKVKRTEQFLEKYKKALNSLSNIQLTDQEFYWLVTSGKVDFIPMYYWEWLKTFRFDPSKINCYLDDDSVLHVDVTDKCYKCTLYEIPVLYLVPEISNEGKEINWDMTIGRLMEKINLANKEKVMFSEFGTRRRFNHDVQDKVCKYLKEWSNTCVGTSNVYFAMKYDMKPIGTHPHEWFMFHGAQYGYDKANYLALENWSTVYDGDLGIGLSDCYGVDLFFHDFSLKLAKLFDGVRQDSGDEYEFIDKTLAFYMSKGIDPMTKTIVFSNALDFPKAVEIKKYCENKIKASFGIGTNLTCDVYDNYGNKYGHENEVMKMSWCRMTNKEIFKPCVKLSDDFGKATGLQEEIQYCKYKVNQILRGLYDNYSNKYGHENEVIKMSWSRMTNKEIFKPCIKLSDDFGKATGL